MTLHNVINGTHADFDFWFDFWTARRAYGLWSLHNGQHASARSMALRYFLEPGCSCPREFRSNLHPHAPGSSPSPWRASRPPETPSGRGTFHSGTTFIGGPYAGIG